LSGGRLVAGLGSGWTETEFRMTGIAFPDVTTRLRMLDEALTCIRGLWGGEPFSFAGEFYRFQDAVLFPKPVQRPHPPFPLAGSAIAISQTIFTLMLTDAPQATRALAESFGKMLGQAPDAVLRSPLSLIGTPEECVAELGRRAREWEVAETIFAYRSDDVLRRLGEEVLPRV